MEVRKEILDEINERLQHYATKADLARMENRLLKWIFGIVLGAIAAISGIVAILQRLLE